MTTLIIHISFIFIIVRWWLSWTERWSFIYSVLFILSFEFLFWLNFFFDYIYYLIYWDFLFMSIFLVGWFIFFILKLVTSLLFVYENYTFNWWEEFLGHLWGNMVWNYKRKYNALNSDYYKFWLINQYSVLKKFICLITSWLYILILSFSFGLSFYLIVYSFSINFYVVFLNIKFYSYYYCFYILLYYSLYLIIISIVFSNLSYRKYYNYMSYFLFFQISFVDLYLHTHSFYDGMTISLKKYKIFEFPIETSIKLFGYKKFRYKKKNWYMWNQTEMFKRYYLPLLWSSYENLIIDEYMDTFFFKVKKKIYCFNSLLTSGDILNYSLKKKWNSYDTIYLSPLYESNLKNCFK